MIRIACPQCRAIFQLADELAGKRVKCKKCGNVVAIPAAKAAAVPTPKLPEPVKPGEEVISPYAVRPVEEASEASKDDRVDQMVRTANRQKRRNRAWGKVGMPATYLKWVTLGELAFLTMLFLWWTMACVLMAHKREQLYRSSAQTYDEKVRELRWLFPLDEFGFTTEDVALVFGIAAAVYFPVIALLGLVLAGSESMRRLENYRLAMAGAVTSLLVINPLGMLCVARLMDKEVQYEFEISRLRREGVDWEAIEDEELDAEEEEEEEDDDDEEEEEEERPAARRRRR